MKNSKRPVSLISPPAMSCFWETRGYGGIPPRLLDIIGTSQGRNSVIWVSSQTVLQHGVTARGWKRGVSTPTSLNFEDSRASLF
jgi:hypothetical protein